MFQRSSLVLSFLVVLSAVSTAHAQGLAKNNGPQPQPVSTTAESDRMRDGLVGPVRRVRTEIVKLVNESGKVTEGKRALLEVVSYDLKGNKVENQYFPVEGATLTGKEVYKYDDKGNISEMTLVNDDGSLISKEVYKYEFDFAGNWNKMTTSVAVVDTGKVIFEPTEVTYRSIMYYLDEKMVKMVQPGASPSPTTSPAKAAEPPANNAQPKNVAKSATALPSADRVAELHSADVSAGTADTKTQVVLNAEPPPPAAAPAPKMILKPVSGGVLNGSALSLPTPIYPDAARRMNMSGTVIVEVVIDEYGKVISARATSGPSGLRDAAVQAAQRAKFSPTKLSGQPVKVSGIINYKFSLAS
jgi:periplasmic protein TonB